ncbi:MAG: hypothetical protein QOE90_95 [Thermoplasmata archaeon]|jgi:hypothetical protein|nr:hypothetical protein [Thermoplasmata archaeon]
MNRIVMFCAVAVAAAMCVPAGVASWGSWGGSEPNTKYDDGSYNYLSAPGSATDHVYFNTFEVGLLAGAPANPAPGLGSRLQPAVTESWAALMGVWVDCNGDGFIGLATTGQVEYRADVSAAAGHAVSTTLCPDVTDSAANAGKIHNHGGWITELIPIAPGVDASYGHQTADDMANVSNYRMIVDPSAKIWGDGGQPGAAFAGSAGCTYIFGSGQPQHTGGVLTHVNCLTGAFSRADATLAAHDLPTIEPLYAPGGPADVQQPGGEESQNSIVSGEFDCSAPPAVDEHRTVDDPTGIVGPSYVNVTVYQPGTPSVNPSGNVPGTINETNEELGPTITGDDCNPSDDYGHDTYGAVEEPGTDSGSATVKDSSDFYFTFGQPGGRGSCDTQTPTQFTDSLTSWFVQFGGDGLGLPGVDEPVIVPGVTCGQPTDAGAPAVMWPASEPSDAWQEFYIIVPYPGTSTGAVRVNTESSMPSATVTPTPAAWDSWYAFTGASGVTTPGASTYGTEPCEANIGAGAPADHGWNCDPAAWNVDAATGQKVADYQQLGAVGDTYNLRDVDCTDNTVLSGSSSLNPLGQDVGPNTVGTTGQTADPARLCA